MKINHPTSVRHPPPSPLIWFIGKQLVGYMREASHICNMELTLPYLVKFWDSQPTLVGFIVKQVEGYVKKLS